MKYFIQTFGCQMNTADSDRMAGHLARRGMSLAAAMEEADLVIVNTCSVRQQAEHRALSLLGRLALLKKKKQGLKVIVAGCAAERLGKDLERRFPVVNLVVGAKSAPDFPGIFDETFLDAPRQQECSAPRPEDGRPSPVSAFVTVMRGCENFCSYCIVPYVRGPETSRKADEVVRETGYLAARGTRDVMLLGQNVNSYRDGNVDFSGLLEKINAVEGIARIRFMTSHPKDLSEKLIDAMAGLEKVCEHLHLPLQ
ncbi:MAG: MiaB/RimO family radical SAM methylthiotransferase, partial [Endomicrobiales bacterium]